MSRMVNDSNMVTVGDLLATWEADPRAAKSGLTRLIESSSDAGVRSEARRCLADIHYLRAEWADALEHTYGHRRLTAFLAFADLLHPRAEAGDILGWGLPSVTKAGWKNIDAVFDDLQAELDAFHDEHGESLVEHFWNRLSADEPLDALAASLGELVGTHYSVERIAELISYGRTLARPFAMIAFAGIEGYERPIPTPWAWRNPHAFEGLFRAFFRRLFRESENRAREGAGLPRVGEGLVSEIRLLRQLREAFPDERVEHQLRPWWLAPQSLDIVFYNRHIAVEYQGSQHSRPVDFFGGEPAFQKQQERDALKRALCSAHGMHLIEVHPDYTLADVVSEIQAAMESADSQEVGL